MSNTVTYSTDRNGKRFVRLYEGDAPARYNIVRNYFEGGKRILRRGLTLGEAQAHCQDHETSSSTCTSSKARARTRRLGKWFDSYTECRR